MSEAPLYVMRRKIVLRKNGKNAEKIWWEKNFVYLCTRNREGDCGILRLGV